jgi:hypothetical protein
MLAYYLLRPLCKEYFFWQKCKKKSRLTLQNTNAALCEKVKPCLELFGAYKSLKSKFKDLDRLVWHISIIIIFKFFVLNV